MGSFKNGLRNLMNLEMIKLIHKLHITLKFIIKFRELHPGINLKFSSLF